MVKDLKYLVSLRNSPSKHYKCVTDSHTNKHEPIMHIRSKYNEAKLSIIPTFLKRFVVKSESNITYRQLVDKKMG